MKKIALSLLIASCLQAAAQPVNPTSRILSESETVKIFADSVIKRLNITFPIRRAYEYSDKTGTYYLALSEKFDKLSESGDSLYHAIKGVNVKAESAGLIKKWEISDQAIKNPAKYINESSIWFWTKYSEVADGDADSLTDPMIVYGTSGENGFDDGRINFIIYYKGQKVVIRHQSGVLDNERNMRIDKAFYILPQKLQKKVRAIMAKMTTDNNIVFPAGYEKGMNKKALIIDENKNYYR